MRCTVRFSVRRHGVFNNDTFAQLEQASKRVFAWIWSVNDGTNSVEYAASRIFLDDAPPTEWGRGEFLLEGGGQGGQEAIWGAAPFEVNFRL